MHGHNIMPKTRGFLDFECRALVFVLADVPLPWSRR